MLQSSTVDTTKNNLTLLIKNMLSEMVDHEHSLVDIKINLLDETDKYNVHIVFDDNIDKLTKNNT